MKKQELPIVLAIDPTVKGFGFTVFEGPGNLVNWGLVTCKLNRRRGEFARIDRLLHIHEPNVVIFESLEQSLRRARSRQFLEELAVHCQQRNVATARYRLDEVKCMFSVFDKRNKRSIATQIATWFPELQARLPEIHRWYEREDERYGIFDAAAFALTHYYLSE